jgi:hypothetical protein
MRGIDEKDLHKNGTLLSLSLRPIRSRVVCYDYIYMAFKNRPTEYRWVITQVLDNDGERTDAQVQAV